MKKSFSINLLFLLGLNLLIKPVYLLGIEVGIQNSVGPKEYGLYYAMLNFTFLFNVLLDMGMNNFQKVHVARDNEEGIRNMSTLIPLKLMLTGAYLVATVLLALVIGFEGRYWFFIGWMMLCQVLSAFLLLLRANLSGLHLFFRDSILSITDRLLLVLGIGYILLFGRERFQIEWFVMFQAATYTAAIILAFILLPKGARLPKLNFSLVASKNMVGKTWPYALLILLMTAYSKVDGVMLERFASDGLLEAGIYAQAYRILDAGNNFAFLYAGLLLPMFAQLVASDHQALKALVDQAARLLIIPAGMAFVVTVFYGDWLMDLLYDQQVRKSAISFKWLMGSFLFIASGYVYGTLITASGKMRTLNWVALGTVVLNVVLNLLLIPLRGSEGAAIASFASLAFMAFSQFVLAEQAYSFIGKGWMKTAAFMWIAVLLCGTALVKLELSPAFGFVTLAGISAVLFLAFAVRYDDLLPAMRSRSI